MSVLTVAAARPMVDTAMADADLQAVIDREEAWLARRIGQLVGQVTQNIWVAPWEADGTLYLLRPTDAVTVVDGGTTIPPEQIRLLERGTQVEKVFGWWIGTTYRQLGPVAITYTPNDQAEVVKALIALVRLALPDPSVETEQTGQYSVTRRLRDPEHIARELMVQHGARTLTLQSSTHPDRLSARTWTSWATSWG